jgi:cell wall-associated NlpC family hydrolase
MGYEAALQRVGELRALTGELPTSSTTNGAAAVPGAFDAQLAQQQALLSATADPSTADYESETMSSMSPTSSMASMMSPMAPASQDPLSQYGVPVLSVADQYRMFGMPLAGTGAVGFPPAGNGAVGQRMVQLAQGELGVTESGGNNDGSRIREYRSATAGAENTPGPWCSYFVSWLAKNAGAPVGAGGNGTGYVPTLEAWGKQQGRYQDFSAGARPQPGDIVIFDWGRDGVADHTGIVENVGADGSIHTIEGNSSDRVQRQSYAASTNDIKGFVRPG